MSFGPLNHTGGERRLNVAVTRAKEHITVVASLTPGDIDLQRTGARGVEDFKHYLEYARHGEEALTRADSEPQMLHFDSEFEEAVYTALEKRGYDVVTQVQSSGYSIDLAIRHPEKPGKYVLGIECDGAAYHSSKTARDRDRTRQAVLEDLGWTIHRIWSPDWASNKERELDAIEERVSDVIDGIAPDGGASTVEVQPVEVDAIPEDERGGIQDSLSDWQVPEVNTTRDRSFDDISRQSLTKVISWTISEYGPLPRETLFRTTISRWKISRLGKNIRQQLSDVVLRMNNKGDVALYDGFVWPGDRPDSIAVRQNTDESDRSIVDIPLEELAKAGYLILEAGTKMTRDDLLLEIARLIGYQRTGANIQNRIDSAIELLLETKCAVSQDGETIEYRDIDADERLLDQIYQ
ncbi:Very-short-patch-repair endonuclease [Halopenitus malekzadehii]|uniref:Very-short-patch-repair endonuclease n=1 Tax=Halopenitus malekzadehii TaxID=1267564 RepID=A0A1H6JVR8_9EURY|nr:DUF559 domain-containing protein [Halopenitus malekzadehii]SEH66760.1 Very-short-patch-repair endonuclease [Halopenitus malekzadehii]